MKLTVFEENPTEEEVKLKLVPCGQHGVRVVVVDRSGQWNSKDVIAEIYASGIRRMPLARSGFQRDQLNQIFDITGQRGPF